MSAEQQGFTTRQVHAARRCEAPNSRAVPIHLTAGFVFDDFDHAASHFGTGEGFGYTRIGNPTISAVEAQLASLESGAGALLLASGQAAVSTAILSLAAAGDHLVVAEHLYEGTRGLILDVLAPLGIDATFVDDVTDPDAWRAAVQPNTKLFLAESLANARNDILDVAAISGVGDEFGIPLVVDNTMATPYLWRPLEQGAAIVVHSASKFFAGQGSVLGGVLIDSGTFDPETSKGRFPHLTTATRGSTQSTYDRTGGLARLAYAREAIAPRFGPTISPLNAFLIGQGAETLSLRVARQSETALEVARFLQSHPAVVQVDYAGLPSHPHHELATRYLQGGFGSVFTVTFAGGLETARTVIESVKTITHMTHIGDVRTLILHPRTTSHALRTDEEAARGGVHPGTVRLSIGIEDARDLIADLDQALAHAPAERSSVGALG